MKIKLLFLFFLSTISQAQIIITPNPFNINSGNITVTYGSTGDYSLFDPLSDPNLLLYTGLETDGNATTWDYHDDFTNLSTMTPLTYNSSLGYYVATLNITTRTYLQEPSLATVQIPNGTLANNWYFLIRNVSGSRQSADLYGSNYGYASSTLSIATNNLLKNNILTSNNTISSNLQENVAIEIFNLVGQKLQTINLTYNETNVLNLTKNQVYIAKITSGNQMDYLKFRF